MYNAELSCVKLFLQALKRQLVATDSEDRVRLVTLSLFLVVDNVSFTQ